MSWAQEISSKLGQVIKKISLHDSYFDYLCLLLEPCKKVYFFESSRPLMRSEFHSLKQQNKE